MTDYDPERYEKRPWPDYEREPLEIHKITGYEVYDPWTAQIRGVFDNFEDAEAFVEMKMGKPTKAKKKKNKK